jgi:hypothetical protein
MPATPNAFISPQAPKASSGVATTANSTYTDTPTNAVVVFTAGANGARVTRISALARATVSATELQLYRDGDGSGTAKKLFASKLMAAYTVAQTTAQPTVDFGYSDANPLILAPGEKLYAAIGVTNTGIIFVAEGFDY